MCRTHSLSFIAEKGEEEEEEEEAEVGQGPATNWEETSSDVSISHSSLALLVGRAN